MAIFAPTANAYRRYRPGLFVPLTANWGLNHRGVSLRVPLSGAEDTRIEHRPAGSDGNPYLELAAIVAGLHHGITHKCDPGRLIQPGEVLAMPAGTIHSVSNESEQITVSLHVYGKHTNFTERSQFDPDRRTRAPFILKLEK